MFVKRYRCALYGDVAIDLLVCPHDELSTWVRRRFDDSTFVTHRNSAGKVIEHEYTNGTRDYVVWLRSWTGTRDELLTLTHETNHLAFRVLRNVGVQLSEESEEAFTYLAEQFLRDFLGALDRKKQSTSKTKK